MPKEIETKFRIRSPGPIRRRLEKIGARLISRALESDVYYRNPSPYSNCDTIRLRRIGKAGIFTVKSALSRKPHKYKICGEYEVNINNIKVFKRILRELGLKPLFRKEKIRQTYAWKGADVLIDRLPRLGSTYVSDKIIFRSP